MRIVAIVCLISVCVLFWASLAIVSMRRDATIHAPLTGGPGVLFSVDTTDAPGIVIKNCTWVSQVTMGGCPFEKRETDSTTTFIYTGGECCMSGNVYDSLLHSSLVNTRLIFSNERRCFVVDESNNGRWEAVKLGN